MYIEATPAYGRDYSNQKDLKADWKANKDFHTLQGYVNKQDAENLGVKVIAYYANRTKQVIL